MIPRSTPYAPTSTAARNTNSPRRSSIVAVVARRRASSSRPSPLPLAIRDDSRAVRRFRVAVRARRRALDARFARCVRSRRRARARRRVTTDGASLHIMARDDDDGDGDAHYAGLFLDADARRKVWALAHRLLGMSCAPPGAKSSADHVKSGVRPRRPRDLKRWRSHGDELEWRWFGSHEFRRR